MKQEGVELQMDSAMIACLLIVLSTGCRLNMAVPDAV